MRFIFHPLTVIEAALIISQLGMEGGREDRSYLRLPSLPDLILLSQSIFALRPHQLTRSREGDFDLPHGRINAILSSFLLITAAAGALPASQSTAKWRALGCENLLTRPKAAETS